MKKVLLLCVIVMMGAILFGTPVVHAKKTLGNAPNALETVSGKAGIHEDSVPGMVGQLAKGAMVIVGLLFFILMVYAGITWMTARGNEEHVTKARNTMIGAVIGLIVLVSSYAITNFIQTRILQGNSNSSGQNTGAPDVAGNQPLGCCLDWINTISDPAARWTTEADCKYWGENDGVGDTHSCAGPKEKCWLWFSEAGGMTWPKCAEKFKEY